MGVSTVTAARILKGQLHHSTGEETRLEMDKFPHVALSKVRSRPASQLAGRGGQSAHPPGVFEALPWHGNSGSDFPRLYFEGSAH